MEDLNLWSFLRFVFVTSWHEFLVCSLVMKRLQFPYVYLKYSESWIQMSNRHYIRIRFLLCHTLTWRPCIYFSTWNTKHWIGKLGLVLNTLPHVFFNYFPKITLLEWKLIFNFTGSQGKGPCVHAHRHMYMVLGGVGIAVRKLKANVSHFLILFNKSQLKSQTRLIVRCHYMHH